MCVKTTRLDSSADGQTIAVKPMRSQQPVKMGWARDLLRQDRDETRDVEHFVWDKMLQGGHKVGEKNSRSVPGFSRAINLLFHRSSQQKVNVIMTYIKGHDDPVYPVNSCFTQIFEWRTKILCLLQFFRGCIEFTKFPEFSMFGEILEYSRFSRFVATLCQYVTRQSRDRDHIPVITIMPPCNIRGFLFWTPCNKNNLIHGGEAQFSLQLIQRH